ncbi:hypothetical protein B484DRAFT_444299 [Ochromonadaceae sp. CCMP2298]|nr:hypothetical protein B484DRAFT_444299 [Ochromonadaceae sp. CCMP2298]
MINPGIGEVIVQLAPLVARYLDGIDDLRSFSLTCKGIRAIAWNKSVMDGIVVGNVRQTLTNHGFCDGLDALGMLLRDFDLALSGSFILSSMLGKDWGMGPSKVQLLNPEDCNDMDLFCKTSPVDARSHTPPTFPTPEEVDTLKQRLAKFGYTYDPGTPDSEEYVLEYTEPDVYANVLTFTKRKPGQDAPPHVSADDGYKLQIIYNSSHHTKYLDFDFSFLRNCLHQEGGAWVCETFDIDAVLNRTCLMRLLRPLVQQYYDHKFNGRFFDLADYSSENATEQDRAEFKLASRFGDFKYAGRAMKYYSRGFVSSWHAQTLLQSSRFLRRSAGRGSARSLSF